LADEIEQPIAVDLAVVEQAQHLAVEIGDTLGDGDVGRLLRAHGGIEDLERHGISLVTASELRSRLQDGMNAEWPPAPPPAPTNDSPGLKLPRQAIVSAMATTIASAVSP